MSEGNADDVHASPLHVAPEAHRVAVSGAVGIVAAAGLLAERRWGGIVAIVALSMALASSLPYGIVRFALHAVGADAIAMGWLSMLLALLNLLALLFWCRPQLRRGGPL